MRRSLCLVVLFIFAMSSCKRQPEWEVARDVHSYSNPAQVRIRHIDLDLDILFDQKILQGSVTLTVERNRRFPEAPLVLDTKDLHIVKAEIAPEFGPFRETSFQLGPRDPILGSALTVTLPKAARRVRIQYATSSHATALQWLEPAQTAEKKHPYLYTQSEAIHARSWIPIQDSPAVRVTYSARIRVHPALRAVMSAEMLPEMGPDGAFQFRMPEPIPSYLIALAVGDIDFRPLSVRTGVYAEPNVVDAAAREFADTEKMIEAVEELYGPYRWGRYDLLVLPPSFPFGGMENPRVTFTTPTIIVGDKSLVSLVAHELAHSWAGNLVTNATWSDFWLNEGFAVYLEHRIVERIYGRERAEMEAVLAVEALNRELATLPEKDQVLHIDLKGRDPDDGMTEVPYVKGALFLRTLEKSVGRKSFAAFLRSYFDHFAFRSITTQDFLNYLKANLQTDVPVTDWVYKPGLPAKADLPRSEALQKVAEAASSWMANKVALKSLPTSSWCTQQWLYFLESLPQDLLPARMQALDAAFGFTRSQNDEILAQWLIMAVRARYKPAYGRLEEFLTTVGRRKYLKPIYQELAKTPEGIKWARAIYAKARTSYHPITAHTIDEILKERVH